MCCVQEAKADPILWLRARCASTAVLQAGPAGSGCVQPAEVSSASASRISGKRQWMLNIWPPYHQFVTQRHIQEFMKFEQIFDKKNLDPKTFDLHCFPLVEFSC